MATAIHDTTLPASYVDTYVRKSNHTEPSIRLYGFEMMNTYTTSRSIYMVCACAFNAIYVSHSESSQSNLCAREFLKFTFLII